MKLFNPFAVLKQEPPVSAESREPSNRNTSPIVKIFNNPEDIEGLYAYTPESLLESPEIKPLIDKIRLAMGSRTEFFDKYLYPSIIQVALYVQKLPASESAAGKPSNVFGHHISVGGLLLHSLETMYFALNDSRLAFFNKGVMPKDRDSNLIASRITCGLAGLLHDIGKIDDPVIVTYTELNGQKIEHVYSCVEPIPDWLSQVHNLPKEKVFCDGKNQNPPVYLIKSWKKGRKDKHEIIAPFFLRSFITRGALKFIAKTSEQLLHNLMTAIDWRVLSFDYTNPRDNIIYNIWSVADKTSCIRDSKRATKPFLKPLKSNSEIRQILVNAFNSLTESGEIAVNQEDQCYIFTHAIADGGEHPFVVLMRFDDVALGTYLRVISKASDHYNADVLQDHEPSLENIRKLLEESDILLPSKADDGLYTVKIRNDSFKAIAFRHFKDVILFNGNLYCAQEEVLNKLTVEFTDGIEPVYPEKNLCTKDLRCSLLPVENKKKSDTEDENESTLDTLQEVKTELKHEAERTSQIRTIPNEEQTAATVQSSAAESGEIKRAAVVASIEPPLDESLLDFNGGAQTVSVGTFSSAAETLINKPKVSSSEHPAEPVREEHKTVLQKVFWESPLAPFPNESSDIYYSEKEPHYNGLKKDIVKAIKELCSSINDDKAAGNLALQICNRLSGKALSYINYVTADNRYAYAAFSWSESIVKDATAVEYIKDFNRCGLFPRGLKAVLNNTREFFYFDYVQMSKSISSIFKSAGIDPVIIKCREHPYKAITTGGNPLELIEYVKYLIISLQQGEKLYDCEWQGYAHELMGRRISKDVIYRCGAEYGTKGLGKLKTLLSISAQATPPYMILDGDELVVGYQRKLNADSISKLTLSMDEKELLDLPTDTFIS